MAKINIEVGIKSKKQSNQPFRPTDVSVEAFHYITDNDSYLADITTVGTKVFDYLEYKRSDLWENDVSFHITLENTTNVKFGHGVIPMPKGHRDGAMTGEEASSPQVITDWLNTAIADLIQRAKY